MKKKYILVFFLLLVSGIGICFFTKPEPPLISVIMGSYNRGGDRQSSLLLKAVDSILAQTEQNFEFIIINDGSTDNTAELLEELAQKDKRIIVLTNKENHGLFYSLNKGLDKARGKYIARMDDDDFSFPNRFQKQVEFMENHPNITATGCAAVFQGESSTKTYYYASDPDYAKLWAFTRVPVLHPCAMLRRDFLEKNKIRYTDKYKNAEDMDFWFKIAWVYNGLISNMPEILLRRKTDSVKKSGYYITQRASVEQYQQDAFKYFLGEDAQCEEHCVCFEKLFENKKFQELVDQKKAKEHMLSICPQVPAFYVKHPDWNDYLIPDNDGRIHRFNFNISGTLLKQDDNSFTLKWDDWGEETFEKDDLGIYRKK